jgi:hypothetical protein
MGMCTVLTRTAFGSDYQNEHTVKVTDDDGIVCLCSGQSEGLVCSHGFAIMMYVARGVVGEDWLSEALLPKSVEVCMSVFGRTVWILGRQNHALPAFSPDEAESFTADGCEDDCSSPSAAGGGDRADGRGVLRAKEVTVPLDKRQELSVHLHRALADLQSRGKIELTDGVLNMIDMLHNLASKARSRKSLQTVRK